MNPSTTPVRLPSGRAARAAFSIDEVAHNQRDRLLHAMVAVVAESGYATATIAAVISRAGVSRSTFYDQFADKQDCFLAAFDLAVDVLLSGLDSAHVPAREDFPLVLDAYLTTLVEQAPFTRVLLLEIQAVGPAGVLRRAASQRRFATLVGQVFGARTQADRFAAEAFVAAVGALITTRLAQDDLDAITALHGPLLELADRLFPH